MAGNTRIPKAELTGIYGALIKRMSRKMLGDVAERSKWRGTHRKVLNFSLAMGRKAQKWDACDENAEVVSRTWRPCRWSAAVFAWTSATSWHTTPCLGRGERHARKVPRWRESDVFTPALERDVGWALTPRPMTQTRLDGHRRDVPRAHAGRNSVRRRWSS